jgi:hypothetical protein
MAVIGEIGGGEDHHPIEDRENPRGALRHGLVPELEVAAVLLRPIVVEIEQDVEPSIEWKSTVPVEVGMDLQEAVTPDLVKAAAFVVRVRDQTGDAGQSFQEVDEHLAVELGEEMAGGGTHLLRVRQSQLELGGRVEGLPGDVLGLGILREDRVQQVRGEDPVGDDVGERLGRLKALRQLLRERQQGRAVELERGARLLHLDSSAARQSTSCCSCFGGPT